MNEIVKLDPKEYGIEESKATEIAAQFKPMLDKMVELEAEFNEVVALPVDSPAAATKARELRLKYVKVRTGTDKIHKEQKAFYLSAGRFVDGWKNTQLFASQGIEKRLEDIEQYAANKERERIAAIQVERESILTPYNIENISSLKLGEMSQSVFDNFLLGTKTAHEAKIEAERIAEEQRVAAIEAERIRIEEQRVENERLKKEAEEVARLRAEEQAKAEAERKAAEEQLRAERAEAERLAKIEADKAAAALKAEQDKAAEERKEAADKLAKEQEAARKLAAELQAKKDAEAKAEAERIAAEKKAAKAPVKEKLKVAVSALTLSLPDSEITADLMAKFDGFKTWALKQIETV